MANNVTPLLAALREQKAMKMKGGIYHKTQIDLTYNSNHIEGSRLTHDQTYAGGHSRLSCPFREDSSVPGRQRPCGTSCDVQGVLA